MRIAQSQKNTLTANSPIDWLQLDSPDIKEFLLTVHTDLTSLAQLVHVMQQILEGMGINHCEPSISIHSGDRPLLLIVCKIDAPRITVDAINHYYAAATHQLSIPEITRTSIILNAASTLH